MYFFLFLGKNIVPIKAKSLKLAILLIGGQPTLATVSSGSLSLLD